jgi:uncharacterized phage protein (TIGR01671 family)
MNKKFRVWDTLAKHFILPDKGYQGHYILDLNGRFHDLGNGSGGDEYVVQQYIGVDDKNKNPIYEGDIVSFQYRDEGLYHGVVDFDDMYAGYSVQKSLAFFGNMQITFHNSAELTVIGNIFENPELLK